MVISISYVFSLNQLLNNVAQVIEGHFVVHISCRVVEAPSTPPYHQRINKKTLITAYFKYVVA